MENEYGKYKLGETVLTLVGEVYEDLNGKYTAILSIRLKTKPLGNNTNTLKIEEARGFKTEQEALTACEMGAALLREQGFERIG